MRTSVTKPPLSQHVSAQDTSATPRTRATPDVLKRLKGICWPGWLSAFLIVAFVLLTSSCQAHEPFIPAEVHEQVNDDGREWTYDTAWQNIRKLNADLSREDYEDIAQESLFIVSQMERLDRGWASAMSSRDTADIVEEIEAQAAERTAEENLTQLTVAAQWLQDSFDNGDFSSATRSAIEVAVIAQLLSSGEKPG